MCRDQATTLDTLGMRTPGQLSNPLLPPPGPGCWWQPEQDDKNERWGWRRRKEEEEEDEEDEEEEDGEKWRGEGEEAEDEAYLCGFVWISRKRTKICTVSFLRFEPSILHGRC